MDLYELLALALMVGGIWLWLDSLKAREIGIQAAQRACAEEGLQFLDETVEVLGDMRRLDADRIHGAEECLQWFGVSRVVLERPWRRACCGCCLGRCSFP